MTRQLRHPLTWCLLAVLGVIGFILVRPGEITLAGRTVSLRKPHNAIHFAYVLVFLRLLTWWLRGGRSG